MVVCYWIEWGTSKGKMLTTRSCLRCSSISGGRMPAYFDIEGKRIVLHTFLRAFFMIVRVIYWKRRGDDPWNLKRGRKLTAIGIDWGRNFWFLKRHISSSHSRILDAASESAKGIEKIGSTLKAWSSIWTSRTQWYCVGDLFNSDLKARYDR